MLDSSISDFNKDLKLKGFKVYEIDSESPVVRSYSRKDFFKICLNKGRNIIHYSDKSYETKGAILFFGNPHIPYSWEIASPDYSGYACLFSEDFLKTSDRTESLLQSPLFKLGGTPILHLDDKQEEFVSDIFRRMIAEQESGYAFKAGLIRNYVDIIIHEALKMQPSKSFSQHKNAATRITSVFLELLERQFPIESTEHPLQLRTAQDYAQQLSVHVNHLNRSVKEVTGRSTTTHIAERIVTEAKALLQHTNWTVAEVAYALGFEYPTYFNNYFRRIAGVAPSALRA